MKKLLFLTAAIVMFAAAANAQNFEKGDWLVRADVSNLSFTHAFTDDNLSVTSFNIGADAGYFLSDKFVVEASLGFDFLKIKDIESSSADFTFGVAARYYPVGNLFAYVGYDGIAPDESSLLSALEVAVGYDLFLSDKIFFEPAVYYSKYLSGTKTNNIGISLGIGVKF